MNGKYRTDHGRPQSRLSWDAQTPSTPAPGVHIVRQMQDLHHR